MNRLRKWLVLAVALGCLVPAALADSFTLTGVSGQVLGGVYTGPYYATINGVEGIKVVCDDFSAHSYVGQSFTANPTSVADLTGSAPSTAVKFNQNDASTQQKNYATAAYLAIQLLEKSKTSLYEAGLVNYALWGLFTPSAFNNLGTTARNAAQNYLTGAQAYIAGLGTNPTSYYANVTIWTPEPLTASQEFITVSVPEPATLFVYLLGGIAAFFFLRRRSARVLS